MGFGVGVGLGATFHKCVKSENKIGMFVYINKKKSSSLLSRINGGGWV